MNWMQAEKNPMLIKPYTKKAKLTIINRPDLVTSGYEPKMDIGKSGKKYFGSYQQFPEISEEKERLKQSVEKEFDTHLGAYLHNAEYYGLQEQDIAFAGEYYRSAIKILE